MPKATEAGTKSFAQWFGGTFGVGMGLAAGCAAIPLLFIGGCIVLIGIGSAVGPKTPAVTSPAASATIEATPAQEPAAPAITLAKFNRIYTDMSYAQVVEVLGVHGTIDSENKIGDIHTVMYSWKNDSILDGAMNAMFQNDRLIQKSQFGLK